MIKFLIIRFSSIGDIVLTTPIVRCLKTQVKDSEIQYLVKSKFKPVIEANPYINKIYVLDNNFGELLSRLNEENFDYIIDLHHNIRTFRVKQRLHRIALTYNKLNFEKWLMVNLKINKLPNIHIVDRYFEILSPFSIVNDQKGLDFFIKRDDEILLSNIHPDLKSPFIILAIGGGHFTKQIPIVKIIELLGSIDQPVVLLGGVNDIDKSKEIERSINKSVYNLVGKLNIGQSASLINQAELILTPDTGIMHIAAAFKKKIYSIWGNTIPEFGMYPYLPGNDSEIFEVKNLYCRPCSKIGFQNCPKKHFKCMMEMDFNKLAYKINKHFTDLS
jgi:ADP-heptose:LPS heptosyltransferase